MTTLTDLGTETLLEICKHFCVHCSGDSDRPLTFGTLQQHEKRRAEQQGTQDPDAPSWYSLNRHALYALSLTCRRFYGVAQSILYHEFILGYGDSWKSKQYSWDRRLTPFMRTMSRRRDLATRVQRVSIHPLLLEPFKGPNDEKVPYRLMRAPAIGDARMALKRSAAALDVDLATAWKRRWAEFRLMFYPDGFLSAFLKPNCKNRRYLMKAFESSHRGQAHQVVIAEMVAMLIALLPNLKHLSLLEDGTHWSNLGFPNAALRALNVSSLSLRILDTELPRGMIPKLATGLQELNIHHCRQYHDCPELPALKILRVVYFNFGNGDLDKLLSCCTGRLHTFVYETHYTLGSDGMMHTGDDTRQLRPRDIIRRLEERHGETLEVLHLDMGVGYLGREKLSIRGFAALRHVLLTSSVLFGWSQVSVYSDEELALPEGVLPETIETLCLVCPQDKTLVEAGLVKLADLKQRHPEQFPNLEKISVDIAQDFEDDTVRLLLEAVGVSFGFEKWPRSEPRAIGLSEEPGYLTGWRLEDFFASLMTLDGN